MPSTIPYDPSLILGNLVHPDAIAILEEISTLQAAVDGAEDDLNASLQLKNSLGLTIQELTDLAVNTDNLTKKMTEVDATIVTNAGAYADAVIKNMPDIQKMKKTIRNVHQSPESPIDYNQSQIKIMPLAADSLKMNVQYFSFASEAEGAQSVISKIGGFVSGTLSELGDSFSAQAASQAQSQVSSQRENHDVVGTLVMSVACTHKNASVFAPFIIDVDKAIRVWNMTYPKDKLETTAASMSRTAAAEQASDDSETNSLYLLSGASYGSSFVGMVHVLNTAETQSSQTMMSIASQAQASFEISGWIANASGNIGVDSSFSQDIKNLFSQHRINSHVSLVVMGVIPSIKSNELQTGVQKFADFDGAQMMEKLSTLANVTQSEQQSVAQASSAALAGGKLVALENAKIQSVMTGLDNSDKSSNQMLDINSMMTAFEDYVNKAMGGDIGVPINYYLKPISKFQLAQMWVAKYFPNKYIDSAGDDSKPADKPAGT